jgi:DNA-directed RNA polymerase specialized sigma24 family protein
VAIRPNGAIGALAEGQLLERFATQDGEAAELAFAALVKRRASMVLRVCRITLRDPNAVQDAFQATVLALVDKGRSLWDRDSLGPWPHRVAHHVATRARSSAARRRELERRAAVTRPTLVSERGDWEVSARSYQLAARADVGRAEQPCWRCWTRRGRAGTLRQENAHE